MVVTIRYGLVPQIYDHFHFISCFSYCMHPNLCSVPESWCCEPCQYHVNHHDNCHSESSTHRGQELEDLSIRENACAVANESSKVPDATKMVGTPCQNLKCFYILKLCAHQG